MSIHLVAKPAVIGSIEVLFYSKQSLVLPTANPLSEGEMQALGKILQKTTDGPYGDCDWVEINGRLFILLDLSKDKALSRLENLRLAAYRLCGLATRRQFPLVSINLQTMSADECSALLAGLHLGAYHFDKYKSKPKPRFQSMFELVAGERLVPLKSLAQQVAAVMEQVNYARDLVNEPGSSLTPDDLVAHATALSKSHGLKVSVRNAKQLAKDGFQGLISVGKGSPHSPAMVTIQYRPKKARPGLHLGFLGKGLTFDTGGISLKPATDMWEMKMDMAGAAAALAGICAVAALKLPVTVTAVLCIAENRPSGIAQLPGDIFTAKNGKTVMVDNTDAEGRLVLTDGLWEAGAQGVTHLIDLATLTGAVIRSLGTCVAGLFTNSSTLGELVLSSGLACGEKFWPLPLEMEYLEGMRDKVADFKNVSGEVGAVTAALFLHEFVPPGVAWAHLDIAGTAFTKKQWKYFEHGGTGFGVQTLVQIAQCLADPTQTLPNAPQQDVESSNSASMPGKRRGRPPKARTATPAPRSTVTPMRRRGRPPKSSVPASTRRPGRPRKNPPQG